VRRGFFGWLFFSLSTACLVVATASAQTTVNGSALALRSYLSGTSQQNFGGDSGTDAILNTNGYVGTYITLPSPGTVTLTASALGLTSDSTLPELGIAVDDSLTKFNVSPGGFGNYTANVSLPAGTHFVRLQYDNDKDADPINGNTHSLAVRNLQVTGATVDNSPADFNQTALDAANTYITNFRQGNATVHLVGAPAGSTVQVDMTRNAFNFGGTVSGTSTGDPVNMLISNPGPTTEAGQFQSFINQYFNTIVPSNAGKWASNEANPPPAMPTMQLVDTQLAYAQAHNQKVRMHNLIWGSTQQPTWVNTLINSALAGSATDKTNLSNAITSRISYYVGGTNVGNAQRASKYIQVDGLNEALHAPTYWTIYGASGIAGIYNQILTAAAQAGNPNLRTLTNEYNVLQFSPLTLTKPSTNFGIGGTLNPNATASGSDPYANWYRDQVDQLNNAGLTNFGHNVVTEVGIELYADVNQTGSNALSTNTMQQALQNLSVPGLPISMNEFGMRNTSNNQTLGPAALDNAMRMIYGNPQADTFMVWGWWNLSTNSAPPAQMIVTTPGASSYTLTALGQKWVDLMNEFSTHVSPSLANGEINFDGYYGNYTVTVNGVAHPLTLTKGTTNYAILINPTPGDLDLDGKVTNADLQAELSALADPNGYEASTGLSAADLVTMGDVNGDHAFDVGDLGALMNLLSGSAGGGSTSAVPEPSTFLLYVLGGSTAALSLTVRNLRAHRSLCLKSIEAAATTH
jgi:GH35 family endo-1,4-beta-xylanase